MSTQRIPRRCQGHGLYGAKCRQPVSYKIVWPYEHRGKPQQFTAYACEAHTTAYTLAHPGEVEITLVNPIKDGD